MLKVCLNLHIFQLSLCYSVLVATGERDRKPPKRCERFILQVTCLRSLVALTTNERNRNLKK